MEMMRLLIKLIRWLLGYPEDKQDSQPVVYSDMHPAVSRQREVYAMNQLDKELKALGAKCKVSRREALCKLMEMGDVNYKERSEVEKFFWGKGVSDENITALTDEFYRLQHKQFHKQVGGE